MHFPEQAVLRLPEWIAPFAQHQPKEVFATRESRMGFVIGLSRQNVLRKTGGPFAAAVFERDSGALVSAAVNAVVACRTSLAHAEAMALMLAQQYLGSFDLGAARLPAMELYASSQPCVQCYGNTWWSGVCSLVIGARAEDVEELTGFKEGPLPADWARLLEERTEPLRPVSVTRDILREEARAVLRLYSENGGFVYNAGADG